MSYIGQREDEWHAEQRKKKKQTARRVSKTCPVCQKRVKNMTGLKHHLRDAHQRKLSPPEPKIIKTEPL